MSAVSRFQKLLYPIKLVSGQNPKTCDDDYIFIHTVIFKFQVKETVLTSLTEAQKILDSTMSVAIEDIRGMFTNTRRKRNTEGQF